MILTLLSLEITSVKNMRLFLKVAEQLGYGPEKVRLVLNRADSTVPSPGCARISRPQAPERGKVTCAT